jgi:hypothetical protein
MKSFRRGWSVQPFFKGATQLYLPAKCGLDGEPGLWISIAQFRMNDYTRFHIPPASRAQHLKWPLFMPLLNRYVDQNHQFKPPGSGYSLSEPETQNAEAANNTVPSA